MTIIEPHHMARSRAEQNAEPLRLHIPAQARGSDFERRTASFEKASVLDRDAHAVPRQAPSPAVDDVVDTQPRSLLTAAPKIHTPSPLPSKRVNSVRRAALLSDGFVLTGFAVAGLAFDRWIVTLTALAMLVFITGRLPSVNSMPRVLAVVPVIKTWAMVMGPACAVVALSGSADTGRELILGGLAILTSLVSSRLVLRTKKARALLGISDRRRCVVVGDDTAIAPLIAKAESMPGRDEVVGVVARSNLLSEVPRQGQAPLVESVVQAAISQNADQVTVVSGGSIGPDALTEFSWALEDTGIDLAVTTGLESVSAHRIAVTQVGDRLLMHIGSATPRGMTAVVKGAFDRIAATFLCLLLAPVFLGLVIAVRRDSPGPAVFRQSRVRKGGHEFTMYKFRTMHINAESALQALRAENEHGELGVLFKMRNDPRVTRLGQTLRRTSLDELPQLFNVIKGDMSLIGPRPALPTEVARYDKQARRRLAMKPGMTGLWQVSGRSTLNWKESLKHDLDYVDNWSPARETKIAWKTVKAVLDNDGAY